MGNRRKLSLTGQWQFWSSFLRMSLTGQWQFLLPLGMGYHRKLSLTGQWQFSGSPGPIGSCLKQRIIPLYGHTTYGHMSLTTVNDKSLWTKLKKVSLTLVNDKKIVIDHGQWQKKLSLTERYLYRDIIDIIIGEVGGVGRRPKQVAGAVVMLSTQGRHGSFEASRGGGDQWKDCLLIQNMSILERTLRVQTPSLLLVDPTIYSR